MTYLTKYVKFLFLFFLTCSLSACNDEKISSSENTKRYNIVSVHFSEITSYERARNAFFNELKKHGYSEKNVTFHLKNADGDRNKLIEILDEVALSNEYDILMSSGTVVTRLLMQKKQEEKPLVFSYVEDPINTKIVFNPQNPENNVTGVAIPMHYTRLIDIARKLTPNMQKIAILNENIEFSTANIVENTKLYLSSLKIDAKEIFVKNKDFFNTLTKEDFEDVDCVFIPNSNFLLAHMETIVKIANEAKIPVYTGTSRTVKRGALASVSVSVEEIGEVAARFVANIIDGKEVKDLPIYVTPSRIITINEDVVKSLNITIPDTIPPYTSVKFGN